MITSFHAKYFAHELTRRHGPNDAGRLSQSLFDASVDLNPHLQGIPEGGGHYPNRRNH
jgi:hypothetical protein